MEITTGLLTLFLMLATSAVIAWLVISQRKGVREKQPPKANEAQQEVDEMRPPTPAAEDQLTTEQEGAPIAQETQSTGEKAQPTAAQEVERIVPKETQPTALPETTIATREEAESTAVQGAEQIEGEETHPGVVLKEAPTTTPEESQTTLVEKVQPQVVEKPQPTRPIRGRPRRSTRPQEGRTTREKTSRRPKPEIVCWKRERQWLIGVEVPEESLGEGDDLEVYQNGVLLSRDDIREGFWLLNSLSGQITAQRKGEPVEGFNLSFGQDGYLLFKLSGEGLNQDQGRLVKSASSGSYLVVAPNSWERDESAAGSAPVMPESVILDGYIANFFDLEKSGKTRIALRTPEGDPITPPLSSMRFELVGVQLEDITEGVGPLFSEPPKIRALDPRAWKGVKTIVIGEEGPGRGKWRTEFSPNTDGQEQELPSEVRERRGGWYFIRFYDNDQLIESMDFRFVSGLKHISMPELSPVPSKGGHEPACVQLIHEPGITIQTVEDLPHIRVECGDGQTTITVPPDPKFDVTRWLVGYENGSQVEVTILVERLWWSLGEEAAEPSQWEDKPLALSPDDLIATSKKTLWLRFPKCRWVDNILAGFERAKARPYSIKVAEKTLPVPLREFADTKEAMDQTQDQRLKVWVERDNVKMEGVVAVISARWVGIGRYKTALATVVLQHGSGNITVKGFTLNQYFREAPIKARRFLRRLRELPTISDVLSQLDAFVDVKGSNPDTMRQARAVAHALARALMVYDPELKPSLKREGFGGVKVRSMFRRRRRRRIRNEPDRIGQPN